MSNRIVYYFCKKDLNFSATRWWNEYTCIRMPPNHPQFQEYFNCYIKKGTITCVEYPPGKHTSRDYEVNQVIQKHWDFHTNRDRIIVVEPYIPPKRKME
jgi:hypothetical protein